MSNRNAQCREPSQLVPRHVGLPRTYMPLPCGADHGRTVPHRETEKARGQTDSVADALPQSTAAESGSDAAGE